MSAPSHPYDTLGLEFPFTEHNEENDRHENGAAWSEVGESPFAQALEHDEASQPESAAMQVGEEERLAWLDLEEEAPGTGFELEDEGFDEQEALHEHGEARGEYLDDEERDAGESYEAWQEQSETEAEAEAPSAAPLGAEQRAWVLALDRSAIERLRDTAARDRFLAQDWSDIEFPGNVPKGQSATATIKQHWTLARSLFNAMEQVVPERRVPSSIRFMERPVVKVPGQSPHRLFVEARDAFVRMHAAAKAEGVDLVILSSWRSRARQAAASANQPNPNAVARKASAHMYGLAMDVRMGVAGLPIKEINTRVDRASAAKAGTQAKMGNLVRMYRSPVYKWLFLRAREFGWYPYRNEPWHWEYNPPGLKARFENATRGELEHESGYALEASPYTEASQYEDEYEDQYEDEAAPSPFLRTFTAKALDVKVAVYVTQAARNAREVEMLVYAHGLDLCNPVFKNRPATFVSEAPFKLGALVEASGRPIVLVVPFLDWEQLATNSMSYGRKWHRIAQPETFNRVAVEAMEQVRSITNNMPTLRRLILSGHSRAYGFFDALAHEHASPHMRSGALSCPMHVWALDTTYSAPIADWRAWLRSREDLQATVVFRQGRYQAKGSTVVKELATGIRGREFAKLAGASNGRLTAMPVAANKVSHCAIPATYLPRLLAALPALSSGAEFETREEGFDTFEDEAGLAAEAEAPDLEEGETQADPPSPIVINDYPRYDRKMPPGFRDALQPLVAKILDTLRGGGKVRVSIVGHADFDAQGRAFETKVSVERASVAQQTLLALLMSQAELAGIGRDALLAGMDLTIAGMGTKQPSEPRPVNEEQRRKNRRVEFFWEATSKGNKRPPPPPPPPDVPTSLRLVGAGVWTKSSTVQVQGEQVVRFVVKNQNVLPTSVVITDDKNGGKQTRSLLPGQTAEMEFSMFGAGVRDWQFSVGTNSQAFVVFWQAYSFVPEPREHWAHETADESGRDESGRFDAFGDGRDSEWGAESSEELAPSLDEDEAPQTFALDTEEETSLSGSGLTPAEQKAVEITSLFETGKRGGFYGLSGNFDGQGLSFGLVNWTIGTGSLQPLLRDFAKEHPARWVSVFGADASRFLHLIARKDKAAQAQQHRFAIEVMNTVSTNARGRKIWTVRQPWVGYFRKLSEDVAFQRIQVRYVRDLLARAEYYCKHFQLRSEQAFCFMFDAVASHGKWWLVKKFNGAEKRRVLVEQALKAVAARYGAGRIPESDVLLAIADVLATTSAQRWADNVRQRKRWFVTGQHPRKRELEGLGPRPDLPYATSKNTVEKESQDAFDEA